MLAAIGASVCCVGPLLLLMLGIGGAWIAQKPATVTFDADQTGASALVKATTDAGYPSTVRQ
jgi:copper chaperone CopZ